MKTLRFLWWELRPFRDWAEQQANGPCFDLCMCRACWRGWSGLSRREKLTWRLSFLAHRGWWS